MQVVLTSTRESTSIEELVELADKIAEVPHRYPTVSTVMPATPTTNPFLLPTSSFKILDLRPLMMQQAVQIQTLTTQIQALSLGTQHQSSSRSCRYGAHFLVDTSAEVSIIPVSNTSGKRKETPVCLQAFNHSPIPTYGEQSLTLNLGLCRTFQWVFVIAKLLTPILEADFLHHFRLLCYLERISRFTRPVFQNQPIKHEVTHHIKTRGPPVAARPRRLPSDCFKAVKREFRHMLDFGIIHPSSSNWSLPIHYVSKKSSTDCLSRRTVSDHIKDIADDIQNSLKSASAEFVLYSSAIDETTDLSNTSQMAIFIHITGHLNNLNLKLQGSNQLITSLLSHIKSFKLMLL
uniref:Peptidase A2 domain-containing protein n=1 Tax=Octopus bimaculoides TaxID=37653 RepID=A0A0L8FPY5_OCTBM